MEVLQKAAELNLINNEILMPNVRQIEWYNREKMIFFHFGMNTFTNKEWGDGTEEPAWFNPDALDTRQWLKTIKDAGFKCAILTAKHHDGFCLWPTKYTEHSIKNSPYKNGNGDIVKEFTDACAEFGIKAGIYLSPWDRHEKTWGHDEYNDFYVGQLTELLTNYGKIWEVWWDGAGSTEAVYDWDRWAKTVKELAPDATIFGSLGATPYVDVRWVGNEKGIAGKPCYATIDKHSLIVETTSELNAGKLNGDSFIPAEVDVSIRPGWFYHKEQDQEVRSAQNLMKLWFTSNGSNTGFLLNLPPNEHGLIHQNDVYSLLGFARLLDKAFKNNLLQGAKLTANNANSACNINDVIVDDSTFFAPEHKSVQIDIELENETDINTFVIQECIEAGHRIVDFSLYAKIGNEYKKLTGGNCVGFRCAEHFDAVKAKSLVLKIENSQDIPLIKFLGLYNLENDILEEKSDTASSKNLLESSISVVETKENGLDVNLGGVRAFNKIVLKNIEPSEYKLYVFNGSSFDLILSGKTQDDNLEINLNTIDYAYRIFIEIKTNEQTSIEVYNV